MSFEIKHGDWIDVLRTLEDESVHCCVTSPPYWGLRDYGVPGQIGLERTPEEYVAKMVDGFREVRRVLRSDGTLWLNLGDSYSGGNKGNSGEMKEGYKQSTNIGSHDTRRGAAISPNRKGGTIGLCKQKDLIGLPWMVAFALRGDGWYLRSDIIWAKPNPMPESVTDRPTKAHEYLFLMSKSERYYYDNWAISEPCIAGDNGSSYQSEQDVATKRNLGKGPRKVKVPGGWEVDKGAHGTIHRSGRTEATYQEAIVSDTRNRRTVWQIATSPFPEAHFATFPPKLVAPCILAGCPEGGIVLDPFNGAGTTGLVATRLGRNYIGIELNPDYIAMAQKRIEEDAPLFNRGDGDSRGGTQVEAAPCE